MPGSGEVLVILLLALLLFGGRELPRVARTLGQWAGVFRRALDEVRREFNRITLEDELREHPRGEVPKAPVRREVESPGEGDDASQGEGGAAPPRDPPHPTPPENAVGREPPSPGKPGPE